MAEIIPFNLSKEEYYELAGKALTEGAAERSVTYLKKALQIDERFAPASLRLAEIYAGLGSYDISNAVLFKALSFRPDEEDENRIFYALANNFLELKDLDVVFYYMRDFDNDLAFMENIEDLNSGFRIAYPKNEDYYETLIEKAHALIREREFGEAISLVSEIPADSRNADAAKHVALVGYMLQNDVDRAIDSAKQMLKESDSLVVKCTLATAYMIEERVKEAHEVLDEITSTDYTRLDDMLLLLPVLVNMEAHAEVVKYTKRVLERLRLHPNTMMWLSQGLYNLGQREEALKVMYKVLQVYGEYSPADYYVALYKTEPESVEYSMGLPLREKIERYKRLEEFLRLERADFEKALRYDKDFSDLVRWAFRDGNEAIIYFTISKFEKFKTDWVRSFYREALIAPDINFELMSRLIAELLDGGYTLDFDVVAQNRFKQVYLQLPEAFYSLPGVLRDAVGYAFCDIIFTDEDPTTYVDRLRKIIDDLVLPDKNGKLVWRSRKSEKAARLRSTKTLVGALLARVYYDDPEPVEESLERYGLNERTFEKYYGILFGDEDDK